MNDKSHTEAIMAMQKKVEQLEQIVKRIGGQLREAEANIKRLERERARRAAETPA